MKQIREIYFMNRLVLALVVVLTSVVSCGKLCEPSASQECAMRTPFTGLQQVAWHEKRCPRYCHDANAEVFIGNGGVGLVVAEDAGDVPRSSTINTIILYHHDRSDEAELCRLSSVPQVVRGWLSQQADWSNATVLIVLAPKLALVTVGLQSVVRCAASQRSVVSTSEWPYFEEDVILALLRCRTIFGVATPSMPSLADVIRESRSGAPTNCSSPNGEPHIAVCKLLALRHCVESFQQSDGVCCNGQESPSAGLVWVCLLLGCLWMICLKRACT